MDLNKTRCAPRDRISSFGFRFDPWNSTFALGASAAIRESQVRFSECLLLSSYKNKAQRHDDGCR